MIVLSINKYLDQHRINKKIFKVYTKYFSDLITELRVQYTPCYDKFKGKGNIVYEKSLNLLTL